MAMAPPAPYAAVSFPARPAPSSITRPRAAAGSVAVRAAGPTEVAGAGGNGKWWAPLLGWSGRADYLEQERVPVPVPVPVRDRDDAAARRPFVGGLTEEKARELRARMVETESFHDAMYHSAIASRLARSA